MQIIILGNTTEEAREKFIKLISCYSKEYVENITNARSLMRMVLKDGTIIRGLTCGDNIRGYKADYIYISKNINHEIREKVINYLGRGENTIYEIY